jgi:hypothetical protein
LLHHGPDLDLTDLDCTLALVGLDDPTAPFDRQVGVGVIDQLSHRAPRGSGSRPLLVAVAERPVDDVIRLRLMEAGADVLVDLAELERRGAVEQIIRAGPTTTWHPAAGSSALAGLGLRRTSRLNAGLAFLVESGLTDVFTDDRQLSRRREITVRTKLAEIVGIDAQASGSGAVVRRSLPSWNQIRSVVREACGS